MKIDLDFTDNELRWISHAIWFYKKNGALLGEKNRAEFKTLYEKYDEWLTDNKPCVWDELSEELEP